MPEGDAVPDEQEIIWPPPPLHQVQPNLDKRNGKLGPKAAPFIALSGAVPALINCFHFNPNFHHVKMILEGGWIMLIMSSVHSDYAYLAILLSPPTMGPSSTGSRPSLRKRRSGCAARLTNFWTPSGGSSRARAHEDREPRVQIYDAPTGILTTIPARELAPGMVRIQMDGVEGNCWMNPDQLHTSPYQHPPLDENIRDLLRQIKAALDEVYPMSLEEWEDGFRRDKNVEREIAIWLHIAEMYKRLTENKSLTPAERGDVFRILLACANNPRDQVLATAGIQVLSRPEAEAVMAEFHKD